MIFLNMYKIFTFIKRFCTTRCSRFVLFNCFTGTKINPESFTLEITRDYELRVR